jgi:hypothetical protein
MPKVQIPSNMTQPPSVLTKTRPIAIDVQLKEVRAYLSEYGAHLDALEKGETFKPTLTGKSTSKESENANGKKRKRNGKGGKKGSPKRRKSDAFEDEDEEMRSSEDEDMEEIESDVDSDDDSDGGQASDDESDDDDASKSGSNSDTGSNNEDDEEETEESLKTKIADANNAIKAGRERLSEARTEKKAAIDGLAGLKKKQTKAQKDKNAFCSLKRSEVRSSTFFCVLENSQVLRSFLVMS